MFPNWYSGGPSIAPMRKSCVNVQSGPSGQRGAPKFSTISMPALSRTAPSHAAAELDSPPQESAGSTRATTHTASADA